MSPLHGVRVLDLSRLLPGPACTWYLYGLGAEILKVEDPVGGDAVRHVPPYGPDGIGVWFHALNAGKCSITLDLRRDLDRAALRALLPTVDVLLEGFRPGVLARLGLAPEDLVAAHPRLIVASMTGYGQTGPLAQLPGHDLDYCALAGALSLGPRPDGVPSMPGLQVADLAGGALTAALGVVAALFERERTGRGQWLDLSMTEGTLALLAPFLAATAAGARPAPGGEALTGELANYGLYRAKDGGVVAVGALEPKFWAAFCEAVGVEVPMERDAVAALLASRDRDEWARIGAQACLAPVLELDEVLEHPQHRARGAITGEGASRRVRPPFVGARVGARAPRLGEHTAAVLSAVGVDPSPFLEQP